MGEEETDEGTITTANHVVMRYLPQHPEFEPEKAVWSVCWKEM